MPGSQFLNDLFEGELRNPDKIVCVSAKYDEFVPIWSSQLLGAQSEVLPVVGHVNLAAFSKLTYDLIAKYAKLK